MSIWPFPAAGGERERDGNGFGCLAVMIHSARQASRQKRREKNFALFGMEKSR